MSRRPPDPFEGFAGFRFDPGEVHLPRPPRRFWVGAGFLLLAVIVVVAAEPIIGLITESQWFQALGYGNVFFTRLGLQGALFGMSFVASLAFAGANIVAALRLRSGPSLRAVGIARPTFRLGTAIGGGAAIVAIVLLVSLGVGSAWRDLVLFMHYSPSGVREPVFGLDTSFYILTLPFLHDVVAWAEALIFLTGAVVAGLYLWRGETIES